MIKILCVGKIKESYLDELINDYKKRKEEKLSKERTVTVNI